MVLSYRLQQNASVELHMIEMLKQFSLQLGEAVVAASWFDVLNLDIIDGGSRYCYNLTENVSFRVSLLLAWRRLCQGQGTCSQSETLVYITSPTVTKKWYIAILIFNGSKRIVRS